MNKRLLFILLVLALLPVEHSLGQTLGEVIQAVDKRHKLLSEKSQIWGDSGNDPINWEGVGPNPTPATVNGKPVKDQLKLLRQACRETVNMQSNFADPRKLSDSGGKIEPLHEPLYDLDINIDNFSAKLRELAARLRLMRIVKGWPATANTRMLYKSYLDSASFPPTSLGVWGGTLYDDYTAIMTDTMVGSSMVYTWVIGHYDYPSENAPGVWMYNTYSCGFFWTYLNSVTATAPASYEGTFRMFQQANCQATALGGAEDLAQPIDQLVAATGQLSAGASETLPGIFPPSSIQTLHTIRRTQGTQEDESFLQSPAIPDQPGLVGDWLGWSSNEPYPWFFPLRLRPGSWRSSEAQGRYFDDEADTFGLYSCVFLVQFVFEADFGQEFASGNPDVVEEGGPIVIEPDLERGRLEIVLNREPENACKLVWDFPFAGAETSPVDVYACVPDHSVLDVEGGGDWEAIYSGKPEDREPVESWSTWDQTIGRWKGFNIYLSEWWHPTLVQLVCKSYAVQIGQGETGYEIDFYRRDQVGDKGNDGRYVISGDPFKIITVAKDSQNFQKMTMSTSDGVNYDLSVESSVEEIGYQYNNFSTIHWLFSYGGPDGSGSQDVLITYAGDGNQEGTAVTESTVNGISLPKRTVHFTGDEPTPETISQISEEPGGQSRITTFDTSFEYDAHYRRIFHRISTDQTGGPNPFSISYDADGLIDGYTCGPREVTWSYGGNTVTRTDKFNGTTERTLSTVYSNAMARAVTTASGASNAASAILECDSSNPYRPWGPKTVKDFDGNLATFTYTKEGDLWKTVTNSGWSTSESLAAGIRSETKVNVAGKVTSWALSDIESNAKLDYATATAYQNGVFPSTYSRPLHDESFTYDGQGRVLTHTDRLGKTTTYGYDGFGRLETASGGGLSWTFEYNPGHLGRTITCTGAGTRTWEETTSPFGESYTLECEGAQQQVTVNRTEDEDSVTTVVDNQTTHRSWTEEITKSSLRRELSGNAVALASSDKWITTYDVDSGKWTTANSAASLLTSSVTVDSLGRVTKTTEPNPAGSGSVSRNFDYIDGRLNSTSGPEGTTSYSYQPDGSLGKVSRAGRSQTLSRTASSDSKISWKLSNAAGETLAKWNYLPATGAWEELPWGKDDRKITTEPSIANSTFQLSSSGFGYNASATWDATGAQVAGSVSVDGAAQSWTATPNAFGEIASALVKPGATGSGRTWQFSTLTGLPTSATGMGLDGTSFAGQYDASSGNLTLSATRNGKTVTRKTSPAGFLLEDGGYGKPDQTWGLPAFGTSITRTLTVGEQDNVTMTHNAAGLQTGRGFPGGASESFDYDATGAMTTWTPPGNGSAVTFAPNAFGQPTRIGDFAWNLKYDKAGRLTSASDATGTHTYTSTNGRLDRETHVNGVLAGQWVDRDYTNEGRLSKVRLAGGTTVQYTYNGDGTLATVKTAGGLTASYGNYDPVTGRAKTITIGSGAGQLAIGTGIDAAGRVSSRTNTAATNTNASYTYNNFGFCNYGPAGTISYDTNGYATGSAGAARTYAWQESGTPVGGTAYHPLTRTNNPSIRVTGTVKPGATVAINGVTVAVDAAGAFEKTYNGVSGWQTYVVRGVLAGQGASGTNAVAEEVRKAYAPPASETLTYVDGNRTADARWSYGWDRKSRLIRATEINPQSGLDPVQIDYKYDWLDRMTERKESTLPAGGGTVLQKRTTYLYDGWKLVRETETDGSGADVAQRTYTWGPDVSGTMDGAAGIGGLLEILETRGTGTTKSLVIDDGMGNVAGQIDATSGAKVAAYGYGIYGELLNTAGSRVASCPLRFQSQWTDEKTGLTYWKKRWYDPKSGTFLSWDPIRESGGSDLSGLCGNHPVGFCDPIGLAPGPAEKLYLQARIQALAHPEETLSPDTSYLTPTLAGGVSVDPISADVDSEGGVFEALGYYAKLDAWSLLNGLHQFISIGNDPTQIFTGKRSLSATMIQRAYEQRFPVHEREEADFLMGTAVSFLPIGPFLKVERAATAGIVAEREFAAVKVETKLATSPWPANAGFIEKTVERKFLMPGQTFDRYGFESGRYASPIGTSIEARALRPGTENLPYNAYRVVKPFEVNSGGVAPAFGQIGLGTQYELPVSIKVLLKRGIIERQ